MAIFLNKIFSGRSSGFFGLDISDYSIEIISLSGSKEKARLAAMARRVIDPGIISNGRIAKKEAMREILRGMLENPDFGKIDKNSLVFSLPESKTFIHTFKIPKNIKGKEEYEAIKSQAAITFPFLLADLYFDFKTIERGDFKDVILVASPKNIVDEYLEMFRDLKIRPLALEIESESLFRALVSGIEKDGAVLIADLGAQVTSLSVFDENGLRLSFSLESAGNKFTRSLIERFNVSPDAAEKLKKDAGLNPQVDEGKIFLVLQKDVQEILREIRRIENFLKEKENKKINKIILAGGSSLLPFLREYLSENLEKEVAMADPWVKIDIEILRRKEYFQKALQVVPVLYSAAIGAALRGLLKKPEKNGMNLISEIKG